MINITVTVPVCEIGEYPEEYTPVAAAHSNKLTTEQREADALRAGLFAANVRVEELRAVLMEVLLLIDGTLRKEVDFPIPAAKVRKVLEGN
jgi:hypothetical protein